MANKRRRQPPITLYYYEGKYYEANSCIPHFPKLIISARRKKDADDVVTAIMQEWKDKGREVHETHYRESATLSRNQARLALCL